MTKRNLAGKIFGVALAFVLLVSGLLGLPYDVEVSASSRFDIGDTVEVYNCPTSSVGLNVRYDPAGSETGVRKYDGDLGMVLDGPQTAALGGTTYTWWEIRWEDGLEGWSAEGDVTEYWLRDKYIPPSTKFSINDEVGVINAGTIGINIRTNPPELAKTGVKAWDGDTGTVLGGPAYGVPQGSSGFYYFWKVDFGSIVGWIAEGNATEDWLASLPDLIVENIWTDPVEFNPGAAVKVYIRIKNTGDGDAVSYKGLQIEGYFDGSMCYKNGIEGLGAGANTGNALYWTQTWPSDSNNHTIMAKVDPDNFIPESEEGNNEKSETFSATLNQPPICSVSANPDFGDAPLFVTFTLGASDPDGWISAWVLDVDGDGNADYSGTGSPPSTQPHTYTTKGTYSVIFIVSDNDGKQSTPDTETVVVDGNDPPQCTLSVDKSSGEAPLTVQFTMSASDLDGWISAWVLRPGDGSPDYTGSGNPPSTQSHSYTSPGTYTAVLMVSDNEDGTDSDIETIEVGDIAEGVVTFPDPNLEDAVRYAIGKPTGDIYQSDLDELTWLSASGLSASERRIVNLTGLEYCTSLTYLSLDRNQISNISPLSTLTNLTYLNLISNHISDVGPLSSLTNLTELWLTWNQISDIGPLSRLTSLTLLDLMSNQISDVSPLSSLTNLTYLNLWTNQISDISGLSSLTNLTDLALVDNQISDIGPLSGLTSLTFLALSSNQISDISALSSLTNLTDLSLWDNQISDIKPLVDNAGLAAGDRVYLSSAFGSNPLSTTSMNTYIPQLEARGVTVQFDYPSDTTPPTITSMCPARDATDVNVSTNISATFSEPMNESTITIDSFTLAGSEVSGTVTYDPATYTATFTPDGDLAHDARYTAGIAATAKDLAGNSLDGDGDGTSEGSLQDDYIWSFTTESIAKPVITSPLEITPRFVVYGIGNTITAQFTISNKGTAPIVFKVLAVGGRDPDGKVVDFDWQEDITLKPNASHDYIGNLILPKVPGTYHFFCTYQTEEGDWDTCIDLGQGLTDDDRAKRITVVETLIGPPSEFTFEAVHLSPEDYRDLSGIVKDILTQEKSKLDVNDPKVSLINQAIVLAHRIETAQASARDPIREGALTESQDFWLPGVGGEIVGFFTGLPGVGEAAKEYGFDIAEVLYLKDIGFVRMKQRGIGDIFITYREDEEGAIITYQGSLGGIFASTPVNSKWILSPITLIRKQLYLLDLESYSVEYKEGCDISAEIKSPAEIQVYDSQGRVTGLVNGEIREEIPNSMYSEDNRTVKILFSFDSYRYQVVGTDEGTYGLTVTSVEDGETATVTAIDIPTSADATHEYTVNWSALSEGEEGVTVQVDSDGDGIFEQTIKSDATLQPPVAEANGPYEGNEGSPIMLNASGSYDADGNITLYEWDFDGDEIYDTNSTSSNITHTWEDDYNGTVVLRVTDDDGLTNVDTAEVTVNNVPPTVDVGPDQKALVYDVVTVNGSAADPGINDTFTFEWDFGDGTNVTHVDLGPGSASDVVTHTYNETGNYTVTLTVTDKDEGVAIDTTNVVVHGALWLKRDAASELEAVEPSRNFAQHLIDSSIWCVNRSLEDKLWVDDTHLNSSIMTSGLVFDMERGAVLRLKVAQRIDPTIEDKAGEVIDKLTKADELLSITAIDAAKSLGVEDPWEREIMDWLIARAEEQLDKAYEYLDRDMPARAITHFKLSWIHAQVAIRVAQATGAASPA